ncbi:hypothetical protein [Bacillus pseudomycoides]|uniref:DUF4303 domain-containing protein n=2 Tax=Bacillus pseudomycoides TaxID=64104 RepID=A0A2B5HAH5_9BACI|nr:hypothetical protein [Bacillus pseudomycoides]PDY46754.1 hypothetical protein CON79_13580 [Bacillus pseudomycoides]PEA83139.1 hypothetical protein CON99_13675 [Bacillus pseudomycoides]PED70117.1 hypothetical protein CON97_21810 [Bacillus pseudomycoides]PEI46723.1 hypothetical protein CN620_01285 [Bacillus pseudomycoides]PEJ78532.1 hypothetical protein CN680_12425 [Bacillus pseudomycoides]
MDYTKLLKRVINGDWKSNQKGFVAYTPEKTIEYFEDISNEKDILLADFRYVEDLFFEACSKVIEKFSHSENNKDVFVLALYVDTEGGYCGISINTEHAYRKIVDKWYSDESEEELNSLYGVRYHDSSFPFTFFNELITPQLEEITNAYYCINTEHPILDVERKIAFHKSFFEEQLVLIGINVMNRLKNTFSLLDTTEDFFAYVTLHDVGAEVYELLIKKTVPYSLFNKLFTENK